MNPPTRLSEIIIQNPATKSFSELIEAIKTHADTAGKAMLEIDIKPDYPDTPRNWEFLIETAFTWGTK